MFKQINKKLVIITILIGVIAAISLMSTLSKVEENNLKSIEFKKLIMTEKDNIEIKSITITNYFLPKTYELPLLIACLRDKENARKELGLVVKYSDDSSEDGNLILYELETIKEEERIFKTPIVGTKEIKLFVESRAF